MVKFSKIFCVKIGFCKTVPLTSEIAKWKKTFIVMDNFLMKSRKEPCTTNFTTSLAISLCLSK